MPLYQKQLVSLFTYIILQLVSFRPINQQKGVYRRKKRHTLIPSFVRKATSSLFVIGSKAIITPQVPLLIPCQIILLVRNITLAPIVQTTIGGKFVPLLKGLEFLERSQFTSLPSSQLTAQKMFPLEVLFRRASRIRLLRASAFSLKAHKKVVRYVCSKILNLLACSRNACFTSLLIILKQTLLRRLKNRRSQICLCGSRRNKGQKIFHTGVVKTLPLLIGGSYIRSLKAKTCIFLKGLDYL